MAPSRGPGSELKRRNSTLGVTLIARFSFEGRKTMQNKVYDFDLGKMRRKKGVRFESLNLSFSNRADSKRSKEGEISGKCERSVKAEMAAIRKSVLLTVFDEARPLGVYTWKKAREVAETAIIKETKRRLGSMQKASQRKERRFRATKEMVAPEIAKHFEKKASRRDIFKKSKRKIERWWERNIINHDLRMVIRTNEESLLEMRRKEKLKMELKTKRQEEIFLERQKRKSEEWKNIDRKGRMLRYREARVMLEMRVRTLMGRNQ